MNDLLTTDNDSTIHPLEVDRTGSPRVWKIGVAAGLVAAVLNTAVAATASTIDVSLTVADEQIPILGFTQLTFIAALVGIALAAVCNRRARRPRSMFIGITSTLTALSMVPVIVVDADGSTRLVLAATHIIAAVLIVGPLAHRLNR